MKLQRRSLLSGLIAAAATPPAVAVAANANQIIDLQAEIEKSIQGSGVLHLPAGRYISQGLRITGTIQIEGVPGRTEIVTKDATPALTIDGAEDVTLFGIRFRLETKVASSQSLVLAENASGLLIENCSFDGSPGNGLQLESCGGRIIGNRFSKIERAALFARNSRGLEISANHLHDIGNNGIQVWTSEPARDGTLVANNRIERVGASEGGSGQNGNAINVFRAGNVTVSGNRISDCAFSGIRNNSGANCQIIGNMISDCGEVAIYCEFSFEGAIVSNNIIEDAALGISITNLNEGGRLAVCSGNVVRRAKGGGIIPATPGVGISAEGDAVVSDNVIEEASAIGISLGWGVYSRNLSATGNLVTGCGRGIGFSVSEGAGGVMISGNRIAASKLAAIEGFDHGEPITGDLAAAEAKLPAGSLISGNLVS